jgi:hypothetical protein
VSKLEWREVSELRTRLFKSDWIVSAEALRILGSCPSSMVEIPPADGEGEPLRADRNAVLEEVVAKLRAAWWGRFYPLNIEAAIAAVRSLGEAEK